MDSPGSPSSTWIPMVRRPSPSRSNGEAMAKPILAFCALLWPARRELVPNTGQSESAVPDPSATRNSRRNAFILVTYPSSVSGDMKRSCSNLNVHRESTWASETTISRSLTKIISPPRSSMRVTSLVPAGNRTSLFPSVGRSEKYSWSGRCWSGRAPSTSL